MQNQEQFLKQLTTKPGVYKMYDAHGDILYVGKASNLKKRVTSYFSKQTTSTKTRALVSQIHKIQVSVTRSETEALLLESSLIKTLHPKYNVLLRDDKSYPYLHVTKHATYPRMEIIRSKRKPNKGHFFGPYPSVSSVKGTLNAIQKVFRIRNCSDSYFNARNRPCLQYQIKRCSAPCTQYITPADYEQNLQDAMKLLAGDSQDILHDLEQRMEKAVHALEFEQAARFRDQIQNLRKVQEQQSMVHLEGDADVIVIDVKPGFACIQCVTIRDGQVLASQSFFPNVPKRRLEEENDGNDRLWQEVFKAFILHHYIDVPDRIPKSLITNHGVEDKDALEQTLGSLKGKKCKILTKPRGIKAKWLDFALNNLRLSLDEKLSSEALTAKRYQELARFLELDKRILRMECFDISHTQGNQTVASCVVFDENGPNKQAYRKYNILDITPGDDYAAMKQVLYRRFKRGIVENNCPDVLIIDGGKGQVSMARQVLDELNISSVTLLGIAKGPQRKAGLEQLILAHRQQEVTLPPDSEALHLLQHIRDEAHRFAITFHRQKRAKAGLDSTLESIPGIGAKRRKALLIRFGGLRELKKAPMTEIAKVPGISQALARKIYDFLQH